MADKGWVKTYREIENHWLWKEKPFSKGQAWIDIILMVNHEDKKIMFNGTLIEVKRGSMITSIKKLSGRWGWSSTKTRSFLKLLENENMLNVKSDNKKTTINVVKYSVYQDIPQTKNSQKNIKKISEKYQKNTNKNDKELIKNEKEYARSGSGKIPTELADKFQSYEEYSEYIQSLKE